VRLGQPDGAAPTARGRAASQTMPLHRLSPLVLPRPRSSRPGFALLKRLVRGVTAFEVDPVVDHMNALRDATIRTIEQQPRWGGADPEPHPRARRGDGGRPQPAGASRLTGPRPASGSQRRAARRTRPAVRVPRAFTAMYT